MGFMGGLFRALGFESEKKIKTEKKTSGKASYSLKKKKSKRVDQIDGIPVYYPENFEQIADFAAFIKQEKAIIISIDGCDKETGERILDYLKGFVFGANAKMIDLEENKMYLILPEGMEIEE